MYNNADDIIGIVSQKIFDLLADDMEMVIFDQNRCLTSSHSVPFFATESVFHKRIIQRLDDGYGPITTTSRGYDLAVFEFESSCKPLYAMIITEKTSFSDPFGLLETLINHFNSVYSKISSQNFSITAIYN